LKLDEEKRKLEQAEHQRSNDIQALKGQQLNQLRKQKYVMLSQVKVTISRDETDRLLQEKQQMETELKNEELRQKEMEQARARESEMAQVSIK
jgi:hypothetical protein